MLLIRNNSFLTFSNQGSYCKYGNRFASRSRRTTKHAFRHGFWKKILRGCLIIPIPLNNDQNQFCFSRRLSENIKIKIEQFINGFGIILSVRRLRIAIYERRAQRREVLKGQERSGARKTPIIPMRVAFLSARNAPKK